MRGCRHLVAMIIATMDGFLFSNGIYVPRFTGETFRVLKEKEEKQHGEYRTRRLILEAWDRSEKPKKE